MASRSEQRKKQKREKKRLKDKQRRKVARSQRRVSKVRDLSQLATLPTGPCFTSDNWHEPSPDSVWVAFSREHPNGQLAAAILHLDLSGAGVRSAEVFPELKPGQLDFEIGSRAGEQMVMQTEPELVAKLITAAQALHLDNDQPLPSDTADVLTLLSDIDPEDCPHEIITGPLPEPAPEAAPSGLLSRLKGWLGG